MEFGPRALGARSILADPRLPHMRDRVNELVKKREGFRPFAPAVLQEHAAAHFDDRDPAPFMTRTCRVVSELDLPAVTHVDGSARLQTVDRATAPRFHELLTAFMNLTGCPVLLNTSFNLRGEPIVCEPLDALLCVIRSDLDALVMEDLVIERSSAGQGRAGHVRGTRHGDAPARPRPPPHGLPPAGPLRSGQGRGRARAYELLGRARDAQCGLPIELTPRCPAAVQQRVRMRSEADGFDLVDLPRCFAAADQSPGRELFLDYCHLSLAGIERVARSVAAQLLHRLDGHPRPGQDRADGVADKVIQVAPIEATAHFLAGVHNAHVGAPMEIVSQRFDQALRICSDVGLTMLEFLDFRNRRKPDWMCASFDAACESPLMRRYLSSLPRPWQETLGDVPLFRALEQALERHGVDAVSPMEKVRRAQTGRSSVRVSLLAFHGAPVLLASLRRSAFLACYQQQARFPLVADEPGPVRLQVTWRVPAGQPEASATIRFNGVQVGAGEVRDRWSSVSVEVSGALVRAGTNDIEIRWPPCDGAPAQPERLELDGGWGIPPHVFHVFGELHRLTAEPSDRH